ncbi:MAG: phosphoribosylanthranilate isomerase [Oryzomonas sp.]
MIKVKICGITNLEDALTAIAAGADALGFVFHAKSPRHVFPEQAAAIIRHLPPFVQTVGLFVNESLKMVNATVDQCGLDLVQLHGEEEAGYCDLVKPSQSNRIILAGGLTPGNVAEAVCKVHPYAVDVSSGVESGPGKKDSRKIVDFISNTKSALDRLPAPANQDISHH